jgi:hypothetical protein
MVQVYTVSWLAEDDWFNVISNVYHFFVIRTVKILSSNNFDLYDVVLMTVIALLYNRRLKLISLS